MDIKLYNSLLELLDLIKRSDEYIELKEKEIIMLNDYDFKINSNKFINSQEEYKRLNSLNLNLDNITKELSDSKSKLYALDVVKQYNNAYLKLDTLLKEISSELIKGVLYESN